MNQYIYILVIMDDNIPVDEQKVSIKASDLLKKFKTKEDRYNFLSRNE